VTQRARLELDRRTRIFRRDAYRCVYCAVIFLPEELTIDHVEPRVKGGDGSPGNLVTCCRTCNAEKGAVAAWAFLSNRPDQRANFLAHATAVWPRLRRAVLEAAEKSTNRSAVPKL
jgi:hypothetical protein